MKKLLCEIPWKCKIKDRLDEDVTVGFITSAQWCQYIDLLVEANSKKEYNDMIFNLCLIVEQS